MKRIRLVSGEYLLIEVQQGFFNHQIITDCAGEKRVKTSDRVGDMVYSDVLPTGQWGIIGKADKVEWDGIVERAKTFGWRDYNAAIGSYQWTGSAKQSGQSLVAFHSMKPETTLILKLNMNKIMNKEKTTIKKTLKLVIDGLNKMTITHGNDRELVETFNKVTDILERKLAELLSKDRNDEPSVATDDASSNAAG